MSASSPDVADLGALAGLAPALANTFATLASDLALVIDPSGVIRTVAQGDAAISRQAQQWVGQAFIDTVTQETRGKIELLLQEVQRTGVSRRREVSLTSPGGPSIPMAFAAIRLGADGPVLAVGRDLRAIAAIQQQFLDAQQALERDYWKQRQTESRYRLLVQVATDAVMVVDAATLTIIEANRAAAELFGRAPGQMAGQPVSLGIDPASRPAVDELLVTARTSGKPAEIRARLGTLADAAHPTVPAVALVDISATPFRAASDGASQLLLLVRARSTEPRGGDAARRLADFVEQTPDAVVITDSSGRLQIANPAFLALCPAGTAEAQVKGRTLGDSLGDPGHRLAALVAEVRRSGIASQVRAPIGVRSGWAGEAAPEVEVSAALLAEGDQECIGFILRRHAPRPDTALQPVDGLALAIENLAAQLGRVSLPELMQEATHLAERHLIRHALERAHGHGPTAADWLGITPESLSLRLLRHGLVANGDHRPFLN